MNQNRLGKRGGIKNFQQWRGGSNQNNRQTHNDHDDRKPGGVTDIKRRVTFKNAGGRGGNRGGGIRLSDIRIRQQLEADEEMSGDVVSGGQSGKFGNFGGKNRRGGMRGRRSGSPPPRMLGFQVSIVSHDT